MLAGGDWLGGAFFLMQSILLLELNLGEMGVKSGVYVFDCGGGIACAGEGVGVGLTHLVGALVLIKEIFEQR